MPRKKVVWVDYAEVKREIIEKLSEMHKSGSTDPEVLVYCDLKDLNSTHPNFLQYSARRGELFQACSILNEAWTSK